MRSAEPFRRVHYAAKPVRFDPARRYDRPGLWEMKPKGLWYSAPTDDDGWEHWCAAEEFGLDRLAAPHVLELDLARMLAIRDVAALDAFHKEYSSTYPDPLGLGETSMFRHLAWSRVCERYAGIEISPYLWVRRLKPGWLWYYGWDCASGVVWDLSAVKTFEVAK